MSKAENIRKFEEWEKKTAAFSFMMSIVNVDTINGSPSQGMKKRIEYTSLLSGELFALQNDPDNRRVMEELIKEEDLDPVLRRRVQLHLRRVEASAALTKEDVVSYRTILADSEQAWLKYKPASDWKSYYPYLEKLISAHIEQTRKVAEATGKGDWDLYDVMLDDNMEGWNRAKYDDFFDQVKARLVPLIKKIGQADPVDTSFLDQPYDKDKQRLLMKEIVEYVGFTPDWGKYGESEHPLTSGVLEGDVRFTTKFTDRNPTDAVLSTVHETGHAWYTHDIDPAYDGTILIHGMDAGMHESQSRLCENHLGRSRAFWEVNFPKMKAIFPQQLEGVDLDRFMRALNVVKPSLVRTQADEVTYPLHILIRYEIEKDLLTGKADIEHLNQRWNELYQEYLGVTVPCDRDGILQDLHWPYAYFGYFPTYALGSAFAAQFYRAMSKDIDVDQLLRTSQYTKITAWMKEHIHKYGALYPADKVMELATGESFNVTYYLDYLEEKYSRIYDL